MTRKKTHGGKRSGAGRKRKYADDAARARAWRKSQVRKVENVRDEGTMPATDSEEGKGAQDQAFARALFHGGTDMSERQDDDPDHKKRLGSQLAKITPTDREHIGSRSLSQESVEMARSGRIPNLEVSLILRDQKFTQAKLRKQISGVGEAIIAALNSTDLSMREEAKGLRRLQAALEARLRKLEREQARRDRQR